MSHKRKVTEPIKVRCSCGRTVKVGPKGYMDPHVTPAGRPCFHRNVPPQRE